MTSTGKSRISHQIFRSQFRSPLPYLHPPYSTAHMCLCCQ